MPRKASGSQSRKEPANWPEKCRSASRDYSVIDWQKKDPQIPQSIWWNNADWVGFRVVRAVDEYEELKGLKSKITKESPN